MKNIQYTVVLEASASSLTQGKPSDFVEAWGGFRGGHNC